MLGRQEADGVEQDAELPHELEHEHDLVSS
jgi:hypothetical protein